MYDALAMKPVPFAAAYTADRAAALAGIPLSTLHYWAREGIWTPSVSPTKVKRWSYADLLGLRLVDWLRQDKPEVRIPRTPMAAIRRALSSVEAVGERLREHNLRVLVDRRGGIVLRAEEDTFIPLSSGLLQGLVDTEVDLVDSFESRAGLKAPNLVIPRPTLRIIPGKLSGEPHVVDTRIPTNILAGLARRGFSSEQLVELYPGLTLASIEDATALEEQLARNLHRVAA
jgi:uncharacterized protein (DUF433 family)/DNA-binding transcriptional MerR regulator